jgi:hypothetical protein
LKLYIKKKKENHEEMEREVKNNEVKKK